MTITTICRKAVTSIADSQFLGTCVLEAGHLGSCSPYAETRSSDAINHPKHYNSHPSGIECITVAEWHNFNIGNVLKYIWRAGLKESALSQIAPDRATIVDLKKARWYIDREIARLEGTHDPGRSIDKRDLSYDIVDNSNRRRYPSPEDVRPSSS